MLLLLFEFDTGATGRGSSWTDSWFDDDAEALEMEDASSAVILNELDISTSAPSKVSISRTNRRALVLTQIAKTLEDFPCERVTFVRLDVAVASSSGVALTTP
jgi:hypothetical protein